MKTYLAATIIGAALLFAMFSLSTIQTATAGIDPEPFLANQLNAVLNMLSAQHDNLDRINAVGSNPPDDTIPVLNSIMSECTVINAIADQMLGDPRGDSPPSEQLALSAAMPFAQNSLVLANPPDDQITNRLQSVLNVLSAAHDRMDRINAVGGTPPDDTIPVLNSIMLECTAINAIADQMLDRAGR